LFIFWHLLFRYYFFTQLRDGWYIYVTLINVSWNRPRTWLTCSVSGLAMGVVLISLGAQHLSHAFHHYSFDVCAGCGDFPFTLSKCVKLVDYWMQWMATIGNLTYQCCPMLRHMRERMLRQTLLVLVTRDTQMIQSSDLPTQRCEIWRYVISRLLSEHQTSFQAFCRYVNCWWHECLAQVANFNWQNLLW